MSFLQIASWNIEHLSGHQREQRRQSAFALADHIEMAGIDILVLQEVYVTPKEEEVRLVEGSPPIPSKATSDRRNGDLDVVCYLLEEHLGNEWQYQIIPNRTSGDKSQLCAVMWDATRVKLDDMQPLPVSHFEDGDNLWDRKPHVCNFTSDIKIWRKDENGEWKIVQEGRKLSVVPIHMKSNYGGVTENRRKRAKEAITLCNELVKGLQNGAIDPTLIVIGDTNILNNSEPAIETFVDSGFIDLNNNDGATYWSSQYGEAPFDRAFVAKDRRELQYTRQYIMRSSDLQAHDRFLSDHYMIKLSVKDYVDDMDPR
ncbi:hypothetical protein [uncultured Roseobacter sp.]|uniref:hypothetical protein n=1 Tax=uncultured Roseobacter sp. TaxID=114847 RepID=UPI002636943E|nr:hypothetical protein [uncultured Roseobacter sp.]